MLVIGVDDLKNAHVVEKYVCHYTAPRLLITVTCRSFYAEDKRITYNMVRYTNIYIYNV